VGQGPGSIGFRVGNTGGSYYIFLTTNGFGYPNRWFFGISPTWNDITFQSTAGYPFQRPVTTCGTQEPFGPVPPGFKLYSVAFGVPTIGGGATAVSSPSPGRTTSRWFYGLDLACSDVAVQIGAGSPFQGPLTSCGTHGPSTLPSGFTLYALAFAVTAPGDGVAAVSAPVSFTTL
jgi:hypothetical protein